MTAPKTSKPPTCKFSVGDTVILVAPGRRDSKEVVVSRVGRVNVYVEAYGREYVFDLGGVEKGEYSRYRIRTVQNGRTIKSGLP